MRGLEKNRIKRGHTNKHLRQNIQLLDQLGPEGRVGENSQTNLCLGNIILTNYCLILNQPRSPLIVGGIFGN